MTDHELLELAAKAAGITLKPMQINNVTKQGDDRFIGYMTDCEQWARGWFNPLTDDGDALRLAVKLKLLIDGCSNCVQTMEQDHGWFYGDSGDACAKTRRAIVRAAAEIGKEVK